MGIKKSQGTSIKSIVIIAVVSLFAVAALMFGMPHYTVWSQKMSGKAALAKAEEDRQIRIEEAKANLQAEELNAKAEVARAKGMAEAIEIESGLLTPTYNQYLFIRSLETLAREGDLPTIIYLPTEGLTPVMDISDVVPNQRE